MKQVNIDIKAAKPFPDQFVSDSEKALWSMDCR